MQIDTSQWRLERNPDTTDFTDLITSGAARSGDTYYSDVDNIILVIPFTPEPTAAEQDRIRIRLVTANADEEAAYVAALNARAQNQQYLDLASPTNAQVLAQVKALTRQNNAIILMLLRLMNTGG